MPTRTGAEFIERLREQGPQLFMDGKKVKDVTTQPGLRNGVNTLAHLYDMQHEPALRDEITCPRPRGTAWDCRSLRLAAGKTWSCATK